MDQNIVNFLAIPVVGVALSAAIQYAKSKFKLSAFGAKITTLIASVVLGTGYWYLQNTEIWITISGILGSATVFWAWFLKNNPE